MSGNNKIKFFIVIFFAVLFVSKNSFANTPPLTKENAEKLNVEKIYKESYFFDIKGVKYSNLEFVRNEKGGGDRVYFINPRGYLVALDLDKVLSDDSSKEEGVVFKKKILDDKEDYLVKNIQISYDDEKIYIVPNYNTVYCVSAINGDLVWEKTVSSILETKPIIHKGAVYVVSNDNKTYALNSDTGIIKWTHSGIKSNTKKRYNNAPITYKDKLIVTYSSGEYYILSQKDGSVVFTENTSLQVVNEASYFSDFDSDAVVYGGALYISGNKIFQAIDLKSNVVKWKKELSTNINFVIKGDSLYYLTKENNLFVIDVETGEVSQSKQLEKYKKNKQSKGVVLYNDMLLVNDLLVLIRDGDLAVYDSNNLDYLKDMEVKGKINKKAIVFNGNLYINSTTRHSMIINKIMEGK